jgi:diacylglycerol O-acyltransferase
MAPMDSLFLLTEDDGVNHMHVGGFATVQGTAPTHENAVAHVNGKLPLIPRYRQVVRASPLRIARPVWVDAQNFVIDEHVRRAVLPSADRTALRAFLSGLISEPLDRSRPLWQLWVIDNVDADQWALFWKIHHCMIDGVSGTELLTVLFDDAPEPSPPVPDHWRPAGAPGTTALSLEVITDVAAASRRGLAALPGAVRSAPAHLPEARRFTRNAARVAVRVARQDRASPLLGPVGTQRSYDWTTIPFDDVNAVRQRFGGTINHVMLTAVLRGYSDIFTARGISTVDRALHIQVPVALRARDERGRPVADGTMTTRASAVIARLPLDVADPVQRLAIVRDALDTLKNSDEATVMTAMQNLTAPVPTAVLALGMRAIARFPQRSVGPVVTNVPGPRETLYFLGERIDHIWSYAPVYPPGSRTGVGIYSYANVLHVGVTGDRDTVPDVEVIIRGISDGVAELVAAANEDRAASAAGGD